VKAHNLSTGNFSFWQIEIKVLQFIRKHLVKVNEKPTNVLTIQCIGTQSPTCFGILQCHHQGVKHDPAEIGAKWREKLKNMFLNFQNAKCNMWLRLLL
jgi:hypothetical protein